MTQTAHIQVPDTYQSIEIELNGAHLLCDYRGVLYLPEHQALVVSDLHLEKGAAFARQGQLHPPYDTEQTLARLADCLKDYQPNILISLGDSFHDRKGADFLPQVYRTQLQALQKGRQWIWISGNHDPEPPEGLEGTFMDQLDLDYICLRHEPDPAAKPGEISGHLHPAARIKRRGKSVKRACFASDGKRLIMPAFGTTTGSLSLKHKAFHGLFDRTELVAHIMGQDRLYSIPFDKMIRT